MQARRRTLDGIRSPSVQPEHAGLWFDRYLEEQQERDGDPKWYKQLISEVCDIAVPSAYEGYFHRWKAMLEEIGAEYRTGRAQGRIIIGLGTESVIETSIRLHATYGVPVIPGSALKGLASSFAHRRLEDAAWRKGHGYAHKIIFGTQEQAGVVTFYDALYIPNSGGPLHPDVITVHHQDYYQGNGHPPADWDNPNPVSFISATGAYSVALHSPYPIWTKAAFDLLEIALLEEGVGAKTSSGYGRLIFSNGFSQVADTESMNSEQAEIPAGYERGRVKNFGLGKNQSFGFITPDGGGKDVFVHVSHLVAGLVTLEPGQYVIYRRVRSPDGWQAEDVRLA